MSNLNKLLKALVEKSNLSTKDIKNFVSFFARAKDKDLAIVIKVLKESPEWISKINKNIQDKVKALEGQDQKAWNKIIEQEKIDLLRSLTQKK